MHGIIKQLHLGEMVHQSSHDIRLGKILVGQALHPRMTARIMIGLNHHVIEAETEIVIVVTVGQESGRIEVDEGVVGIDRGSGTGSAEGDN